MKKCTCCKIIKEYTDFHSKGNGNFATYCKACMSEIQKIKYKHRKKAKERVANVWDPSIDEQRLETWRQYAIKNRSKILEKWLAQLFYNYAQQSQCLPQKATALRIFL
jgi:hypothetical protein